MEKFNLKSMKLLIAIVVVCLIFLIVIPLTFRSYSGNVVKTQNSISNDSEQIEEFETVNNSDETKDEDVIENEQINAIQNVNSKKQLRQLADEEVQAEESAETISTNILDIEESIKRASLLKEEGKYTEAVNEYNNLAKNIEEPIVKAQCYEEIAQIYAFRKI